MKMFIDSNIYHFLNLAKKTAYFKNYRKYSKHTYRPAVSPLWKLWDCLVFLLISIHI